jgi:organic radical activating enzyme
MKFSNTFKENPAGFQTEAEQNWHHLNYIKQNSIDSINEKNKLKCKSTQNNLTFSFNINDLVKETLVEEESKPKKSATSAESLPPPPPPPPPQQQQQQQTIDEPSNTVVSKGVIIKTEKK